MFVKQTLFGFRKLLDFIYSSGEVDWALENMEYWNILEVHIVFIKYLCREIELIIE